METPQIHNGTVQWPSINEVKPVIELAVGASAAEQDAIRKALAGNPRPDPIPTYEESMSPERIAARVKRLQETPNA